MLTIGDFKVFFRHYPEEWGYLCIEEPGFDGIPTTPYRGKTVCFIENIPDGELILEGDAYCSENDIFDKAKGRKISLSRAIEGLSKELRTKIWAGYISTTSRL